jgi:hypothetical protein
MRGGLPSSGRLGEQLINDTREAMVAAQRQSLTGGGCPPRNTSRVKSMISGQSPTTSSCGRSDRTKSVTTSAAGRLAGHLFSPPRSLVRPMPETHRRSGRGVSSNSARHALLSLAHHSGGGQSVASPLLREVSPVDGQHGSGDERGVVGSEEDDGARDFGRFADPAHRVHAFDLGQILRATRLIR